SHSLQNVFSLSGKELAKGARVLVRAVFGPQHGVHPEVGPVRLATSEVDNALVLGVGEPHLPPCALRILLSHHRTGTPLSMSRERCWTIDSSTFRPSALPRRGSAFRSGCGIIPKTFPRSLRSP